ncbi:alpha/beta fold hydrolase [Rhodococcus zopfii]|uniref:alpha/beta fold hydrolase n=1 Tax=Rhodococcus zopfii TaxID=43772 RepID=UPI0009328DB7|nr:alpha/beta hydrolase [Rhodococcus zopfii]
MSEVSRGSGVSRGPARNGISRVTVVADDGVPLAATIEGPPRAALTVVLVHGHCQEADSWEDVCIRVARSDVRIVRYDQRGHGRSGSGEISSLTLDGLAGDLAAVLRALVPTGPVVLAGYSMGGMVAMAYARLYPDAIGARIVGVVLIATAASGLAEHGVGRYLRHPATAMLHRAVTRAPRAMEVSKRAGGRVCSLLARGRDDDSWLRTAGLVLSSTTSVVAWSRLLAAFAVLDESAALVALAGVPVVVAAGTADRYVPIEHSESIVALLPHAELVRIVGAGHRILAEYPDQVASALGRLLGSLRVFDGSLQRSAG